MGKFKDPVLTREHLTLHSDTEATVTIPAEQPVVVNNIPVRGTIWYEKARLGWRINAVHLYRTDKDFGLGRVTSAAMYRLEQEGLALVNGATERELRAAEADWLVRGAERDEKEAWAHEAEAAELKARAAKARGMATSIRADIMEQTKEPV